MRINIRRTFISFLLAVIPITVCSPFLLGATEGYTKKEFGNGRCRIDNTLAVLNQGDRSARLVSGTVQYQGKSYNHMWGVGKTGEIIDVTCTESVDRHPSVVINPWAANMPVEQSHNMTLDSRIKANWNRAYLIGFRKGMLL